MIGGHCNINYFRIEAATGVDLDGNGNNFVQTNLFSVQGKIYDETNTPPGIEPVRITYFHNTNTNTGVTTSRINSWVKAPPQATVKLTHPITNQQFAMAYDGDSTFFRRFVLSVQPIALIFPRKCRLLPHVLED